MSKMLADLQEMFTIIEHEEFINLPNIVPNSKTLLTGLYLKREGLNPLYLYDEDEGIVYITTQERVMGKLH